MDGIALEKLDAVAAEGDAPPQTIFSMPDEDFAKQVNTWFRESSAVRKTHLEHRKRDHEVYGGKQWSDEDREIAKKLRRPALTMNMMLGIIGDIIGDERENRKEIKYFGNGEGDDGPAYSLNQLLKWVLKSCGGEFALSDAFQDAAIAGEGWIGVEVDYLVDPEGKIILCHVDDDEIFCDPMDNSKTGDQSRFLIRCKMWSEDEIEAKWPGTVANLQRKHFEYEPGMERDSAGFKDLYATPGDTGTMKLYDSKEKRWAIMECWWRQIEPGVVVVNEQTGLLDEVTTEQFEQLKQAREAEQMAAVQAAHAQAMNPQIDPMSGMPIPPAPPPPPLEAVERPVMRVYQAFQCVDEVLERNPCPMVRLKRFPYVPLRVFYRKDEREYFGYVRPAIDPQLQHNVEQSAIVHLIQLMPKQSWMGPKGSFHNKNDWATKLAQPGAMLEYDARRGKPEPIPSPPIPRHLIDMAFTRPQSIRDITGVNFEMSGSGQGSDTGVVIDKRSKAGRTRLTLLHDHYRQMKIALGVVLLNYMQHYLSPGRQIRVLGDDGKAETVVITEEMQMLRYDVTVDEGEDSVNSRFEALYVLQTTLPQMLKAGIPVTPEFIDLLPLPPHLRKEWRRQIAWEMTLANRLPPPDWQEGQPLPLAPPPAGPLEGGSAPAPMPQ